MFGNIMNSKPFYVSSLLSFVHSSYSLHLDRNVSLLIGLYLTAFIGVFNLEIIVEEGYKCLGEKEFIVMYCCSLSYTK